MSEIPSAAVGIVEDVPVAVPHGQVQVVARRAELLHRLAHERGDEPVRRGDLLDDELEEMRVVGRLERVVVAQVDLPLRAEVLLVRGDERQAHLRDRVLHLAQDALGVDARRERVDEARLLRVLLVAAARHGTQEEELELVPGDRAQAALVELRDRAAQELARRRGQLAAVEADVADRDRGRALPRDDRQRVQVRDDLRVAEVDLGAEPGAVDHLARMVDAERRDAEVDPVLDARRRAVASGTTLLRETPSRSVKCTRTRSTPASRNSFVCHRHRATYRAGCAAPRAPRAAAASPRSRPSRCRPRPAERA